MNIFAISGFINGLSAVVFGLIVYLKKPKNLTNKIFGLMSLVLWIWSFGYSFWQLSESYAQALFWIRILSIGSTFIPIFFMHWVFALFGLDKKKERVIIAGYMFTFFFLFFIFSPLYIKNITTQLSFTWWPQAGIVYSLYIILSYFGLVGYSCYVLVDLYRKNKKNESLKDKVKYVLLAVIIGFGGGATNFLLWFGIPVPPYGNLLVFLYPFILAYIMLKHQLMDIKLVLTQFLVGAISIFLLIQLLVSKSVVDYFWRSVFLVLFLIAGYFLIKSVLQEVKRRKELQRLYQEVDRLSRAKTEFLSIASHQLRTPLSINKGYMSMILEGVYGKPSAKIKKSIENIYESNERLINVVNDLLNISRLDSGKVKFEPTFIVLEDLVEGVVAEFKNIIQRKGLYLKVEKPTEPLPKIKADQGYFRQAIFNVIDNAIKYTREGGVTVKLSRIEQSVRIEIIDTGEGVNPNEAKKLFQIFSRTSAGIQFHTEGTGLGLYVAKKFIEMHKGHIYIKSEGKGRGSTFYIDLPLS